MKNNLGILANVLSNNKESICTAHRPQLDRKCSNVASKFD